MATTFHSDQAAVQQREGCRREALGFDEASVKALESAIAQERSEVACCKDAVDRLACQLAGEALTPPKAAYVYTVSMVSSKNSHAGTRRGLQSHSAELRLTACRGHSPDKPAVTVLRQHRARAGMDFRYTDPAKGFQRASVKGVLGRLVALKDEQHATALEVAAGGKLFQVSQSACRGAVSHGRYSMGILDASSTCCSRRLHAALWCVSWL